MRGYVYTGAIYLSVSRVSLHLIKSVMDEEFFLAKCIRIEQDFCILNMRPVFMKLQVSSNSSKHIQTHGNISHASRD